MVVNYSSDRSGALKVKGEIEQAGGRAHVVQADVSQQADVTRLFAETKKAFGGLDVLVNNAGTTAFVPFQDIEGLAVEDWDRIMAVNV